VLYFNNYISVLLPSMLLSLCYKIIYLSLTYPYDFNNSSYRNLIIQYSKCLNSSPNKMLLVNRSISFRSRCTSSTTP
jgi:hypothetical protein